MAKKRIGKLRPRYSFILNPYADVRLSKCPRCQKLTYLRKFALFIHIDAWGPMALGKTCRYCSRCELIMAHQNELEAELVHSFSQMAPDVIGNEYLVLGTIDKRVWKEGLIGDGGELGEVLKHMAEFKRVLKLEVEPGGWVPCRAREAPKEGRLRLPFGTLGMTPISTSVILGDMLVCREAEPPSTLSTAP